MRLGDAGDWITAGRAMDYGVENLQNTIRGGTLQQIKQKQTKAYATSVLNLLGSGEPVTADSLMRLAEKFELDPVEASGVLNVVMGFKDQMSKRAERDAFRKKAEVDTPGLMQRSREKEFLGIERKDPEGFTLSAGAKRFGPDGTQVANNPKTFAPEKPKDPRLVWISNGDRKLQVPVTELGKFEAMGFKQGIPLNSSSAKPEMTEAKAQKELVRVEALKTKLQTSGGLDPIMLAAISQSSPMLANAIKGQDVSGAMRAIDEYQNYLKRFIPGAVAKKQSWKEFDK